MKTYKVLTINPGSTSTKIALFEGETCVFSKNVSHDANELAKYERIADQLPYRRNMILDLLSEANITLDDVDVFVGRGGGLLAMEGGTYEVTDLMLEHARNMQNGVIHPAALGSQLAHEFATNYDAKAMVVNPPDVDELQDLARMTGIKGVNRVIHLHALNLKETAIRHRQGKMVDGFDIVGGEGPMAPTRCGSISVADLLSYMKKNDYTVDDVKPLLTKSGGFVSHVGISDALELTNRASQGDHYAEMLWNTMIYQIEKCIGSMATVLHGKVDGILLGGGMVYNENLVNQITDTCSFIAPVSAYPGEFEMEAMAAGAIRVLNGEEELKQYTGKVCWNGFEWDS